MTLLTGLIAPKASPLIGFLMFGNLLRESGVVDRLAKSASNEIANVTTIFLGITIGATMVGDSFVNVTTLVILVLGILAFALDTVAGVLFGKMLYLLTHGHFNPLIGAAGISAFPMAARVVNKVGLEEDYDNFLLMHAMGANAAGQVAIGRGGRHSARAGGGVGGERQTWRAISKSFADLLIRLIRYSPFADLLISARSISFRAAAILRPGVTGRVLASFERACDLVTDAGEVVALVWGGIGNGPLNSVLDGSPRTALPAGVRFRVQERLLIVGDATVDLSHAAPWDARPDWDALRSRRAQIVAAAHIARQSIAGLSERSLLQQAGPAVEAAVAAFQQAWQRSACADSQIVDCNLLSAICHLCGLGPGLTPAGDDWLAGWLLAQHLVPDRQGLRPIAGWCDLEGLIAEVAAERTTTLSRAFLACAAAGEADQDWHMLLQAMAEDPMTDLPICQFTDNILTHGATSGAVMLAGFFAGIEMPTPCLLIPDS